VVGTRKTHGEIRNIYEYSIGKLHGKSTRDLGVGRIIILKWISDNYDETGNVLTS
jgi:hypothetical protein